MEIGGFLDFFFFSQFEGKEELMAPKLFLESLLWKVGTQNPLSKPNPT